MTFRRYFFEMFSGQIVGVDIFFEMFSGQIVGVVYFAHK